MDMNECVLLRFNALQLKRKTVQFSYSVELFFFSLSLSLLKTISLTFVRINFGVPIFFFRCDAHLKSNGCELKRIRHANSETVILAAN